LGNINKRKRVPSLRAAAETATTRKRKEPKLVANSTLDIISRNIGTTIDLAVEESSSEHLLNSVTSASRLGREDTHPIGSEEPVTKSQTAEDSELKSISCASLQQQLSEEGPGLLIGRKVKPNLNIFTYCK
jgi:hypothetical protein